MAGIAILVDLLRKNPSLNGQTFHSSGLFSASLAASAAGASIAAGTPFASRALFGIGARSVAHCDADTTLGEDYTSAKRSASGNIFQHDAVTYSTKEYYIEMKPLFSAFHWKFFAMTTLRSFLLFYLPLLEPRSNLEEDDDNFLLDPPEEDHVDLVVPFKKSVKQIIRETTVVTIRRIMERLAVHYVSRRMAWKLLKDVPKSAVRKAGRGMKTSVYFFSVCKTTFRVVVYCLSFILTVAATSFVDKTGHFLGVAASWLLQVGIRIYHFFSHLYKSDEEADENDKVVQVKILVKNVCVTTISCAASLVFASIGAGVGATFFRPSAGQWIGCALGDLAGPVIVSFCFEKFLHADL
ncbi:hypothetical protein RJ639_007902 [Escallonia herrerae]|uniref:Uncharacterized protein n=1 Tax=Escallonia herrerae TaxID=1293975 RepID=A0AA89ASX2_9ASTE|nr:hypothetical protein RJ639_007902 [Escallonia herrerae]